MGAPVVKCCKCRFLLSTPCILALTASLTTWIPVAQAVEPPPRVAGPVHVAFSQAISMAVAASPKREQAQADVAAATARHDEALAGLGPKVNAAFASTRYDKDVAASLGADSFSIRPSHLDAGDIVVSQPVTGIYTAMERAGMTHVQQDVSVSALDRAKADAAFGAAEAYRQAQEADEMVRIAQAGIAATAGQVHDAESLAASGRLIRSDLLKIKIAQQEARAQLAKSVAVQKKAHERLRYAVGLAPGQDVALDPLPPVASVQSYQAPVVEKAVSQAETSRLELREAALGVEQAAYGTRLARWQFAPQVDVFAKWEHIYSPPPFGTPDYTRSYGVPASWELWDNGSRVFAARAAQATVQKAATALQETKDHVRLEIEALEADLQAAKESLAAAEASVKQAEEAYRLDKARFASGLVTATDLLLSQAGETKTRGALVAAATETDLLILRLERALGQPRPQ